MIVVVIVIIALLALLGWVSGRQFDWWDRNG